MNYSYRQSKKLDYENNNDGGIIDVCFSNQCSPEWEFRHNQWSQNLLRNLRGRRTFAHAAWIYRNGQSMESID